MKLTTCTILTCILGINLLYSQSIQLQSVVSAAHSSSSDGSMRLSGSFGQPYTSSEASSDLTAGFYSASTNLLTINVAPAITINDFDFSVTNPTLSARIEDLDGVASASLWIKPIGASDFSEKTLTDPTDNLYSYAIQAGTDSDDMGIEYYYEASDPSALMRREPESGSLYSYTFKSTTDLPSSLIGFGQATADYRMISIPYQVTPSNDVPTLLSALFDLGGVERKYDNTKWRLYSYNGLVNGEPVFDEYPGSTAQNLVRGKSYWLLVNNENASETIQFSDITAPSNNQGDLFSIELQSGWNMIGNPYTVPISWENVRTYNPSVDIGVIKLFEGDYANGDELLPFQGGIAYLEGAATSIDIPFSGQTSSGGRYKSKPMGTTLDAPNWVLDLTIEQGKYKNTLGGIGMHQEALDGKDRFDDLNPPRFLSYLEMNFPHPEHALGFFSKDIVQPRSQHKWQFSLNSFEDSPITLSWDPKGFGDNPIEIYLYETHSQRLIDMRSTNQFVTGNNTSLEIYYGAGVLELMGPQRSSVGSPYPNPLNRFSNPMTFPVFLGSHEVGHQVQALIYSKEGRLIKNLFEGELTPGLHPITWDGLSDHGKNVPSGLYFYRVSISSGQEQEQFAGKLIISN